MTTSSIGCCHGSGPQTAAPLGWWESMTTRHGLVSNWSHFFQEVPLAWHGLSKRFPEEKNHPNNLGMLKKIPNWCRSEIAFSKKSWWLFIYVFICFFLGKDVSKGFEKKTTSPWSQWGVFTWIFACGAYAGLALSAPGIRLNLDL